MSDLIGDLSGEDFASLLAYSNGQADIITRLNTELKTKDTTIALLAQALDEAADNFLHDKFVSGTEIIKYQNNLKSLAGQHIIEHK